MVARSAECDEFKLSALPKLSMNEMDFMLWTT